MSRKKLTKPLSISFFPAHSNDIFGPRDPMYPGSFDGMSGGLDPSGAKTKTPGKTPGGSGTSFVMAGGAYLYNDPYIYGEEDCGDICCAALVIRKTSKSGTATVHRYSGSPNNNKLSKVGSPAGVSDSYHSDRVVLYSSNPGSSTDSHYGIELTWGHHEDESGAGYQCENGTDYDTGSGNSDITQVSAGSRYGNQVRYKKLGTSIPILIAGSFAGGVGQDGASFEIAIGSRGNNTVGDILEDFSWTSINMNQYLDSDDITTHRWGCGGFDVNSSGQWVATWTKHISGLGYKIYMATGTMTTNSITSCISEPAVIWFPYDADIVAAPLTTGGGHKDYPGQYKDNDLCCVFLNEENWPRENPEIQQNHGVRYPQVVITDGGDIFFRAGTKDKKPWDSGIFGRHSFTESSSLLEKDWTWYSNGWNKSFSGPLPYPCTTDSNTALFVAGSGEVNNGYPVLISAEDNSGSSSYTVDTNMFRKYGEKGGMWWGITSLHISTVKKPPHGTNHKYMAATGELYGSDHSRPIGEVACIHSESIPINDDSGNDVAKVINLWP